MRERKVVNPKTLKVTGFFWILEAVIVIALLIAKYFFHLF